MKAVIFIHVLYLILIKTFMVKGVSRCESKVELRAMLLSCPPRDTGCEDDDLLSQAIKSEEFQLLQADSKNFESLKEEKEKGFSNVVKDCKRKLVITLKIRNSGKIPCDEEYIVVDHVFDPVTGGRGRLLSPVVLKLRQEQMIHLYGLKFQRVVNSDPFEEQKASGQTCSVSPKNPTCGIAMYDGKPIPFSEGFCCSCNSHANTKRQSVPTTRRDSPLYRDYKMIYQGSPHFVRDAKVPIVDPTLIKLKSERQTSGRKDNFNDICDPLSWDKIPNYLLEHDRKVVCDRGDFMNELCKLQEGKHLVARSSSRKGQSKNVGAGNNKKKIAGIRAGVKVEGPDLKNRIAVNADAGKENFLKDAQERNVTLLKNFIKTLNVDQSTGSDNYSSVKGSRGKRENRNENKKLTLAEKLERFANSKSHLANPRKRLLELSHKRRRTIENRCATQQQSKPRNMPLYLHKSYLKCAPPKYFFSHDKCIIDPVETERDTANSSCKISGSVPFEEAKDETYELRGRVPEKSPEEDLTRSFHKVRVKSEGEKITSQKSQSDGLKLSPSEGGETKNRIGAGKRKIHNFEQPLKIARFHGRDDEIYSSLEAGKDNEPKIENPFLPQIVNKMGASHNEEQQQQHQQQKEEKTSRLSCKCIKNLFHKSEAHEKCNKPQKIRNFFMARNRERGQLKADFVKCHKKLEDDPRKSVFFKSKNFKDENKDVENHVEKIIKEEEKGEKELVAPQEKEQKTLNKAEEKPSNIQSDQWPNFSQPPSDKEASLQQLRKENDQLKNALIVKEKEEDKILEERKHERQRFEKFMHSNEASKESLSNSDFSIEIIRQKLPESSYSNYQEPVRKQSSNIQMTSGSPASALDTKALDFMKNYNQLRSNQNFYLYHKFPWKYYPHENNISPSYLNYLQKQNPFRESNNRYRYLKGPGPGTQPGPEPGARPGPGPGPGARPGPGPGPGARPGPGSGSGPGPGLVQRPKPGPALGARPAPGRGPGPGLRQRPKPVPGPGLLQRQKPVPGPGLMQRQKSVPGQGLMQGPTPGPGPEAQPGPGQVPGPGAQSGLEQVPGPGAQPGLGQVPGPGAQPGLGQVPGPGAQPGLGQVPGPGAQSGPGQVQGPGAQPGPGQVQGPGARPGPGQVPGPGVRPGPGPGRGPGLGLVQSPKPGPRLGMQPAPGPRLGMQPAPGPRLGMQPAPGPRLGMRPGPGLGPRARPGPGLGPRPRPGPGRGPGLGLLQGPKSGSGLGTRPGQGPGRGPGLGQVQGPKPGPGPGMRPGPGLRQGARPGPGRRPGLGLVQGPKPGPGLGTRPGLEQEARPGPGRGPGPRLVQGPKPGPGLVQGPKPGPGLVQGPKSGPKLVQGPKPGSGLVQGSKPGPGLVQGPKSGPRTGLVQGPKSGPGPGLVQGPKSGPRTGLVQGPKSGPGPGLVQGPKPGPGPGTRPGPASGTGPGPRPGPRPGPGPGLVQGPKPKAKLEPGVQPKLDFYKPESLDRRLKVENGYLQNRPFQQRRNPNLDFAKYDNKLGSYEKKLSGTQLPEERYPVQRKLDNGRRPETFQGNPRQGSEKIRSKRSSSYSSQPSKSELDSQSLELEPRLPAQSEKARKSEKVTMTGRATRQTGRRTTRFKRENVSSDANGISNSQRVQSGQSGINCPVVSLRQKTIKAAFDKQRLIQSYLNAPDYVLEEVEAALKEKRQATNFSCPRGSERTESDEQEAQDIAHCMRFGDMWYSLYTISKPIVSQTVGIQLFDKHLLWDGTAQWRDLTKGKMIRVGTYLTRAEDELPSISVTFSGESSGKVESAIDPENYYLLIPSHVSSPSKMSFYPQFEGGPAEYLLVHSKDVSSGGECNMVGTSFEAFARQPDRCNQPKGSCFKRQPVDLWREDMEARIRGKRGKYFVENFGTVSNSSVKTYTNLSGEFLALEYYGEYTSTIEIEVKADSNAVVRKGSVAQIPLVYVDSTYPKKTRIILSVLNIGLTSSFFRPRLGDCPPDLDPAWCPLEGPLVTIPPQQRHDFKLDLSGALPSRQILVSVQVLNQVNKMIASRRIHIVRGDRCVCAFHCKCNCIGDSGDDRTCHRLGLRDYRKAGYITSFPFRGGTPASTPESIRKNIRIVFLTAAYVLLLLGVVKGVLGIFIRRIGIAGIKIITGPRELTCYYESELQSCSVLFDEYGFPVHPTTCQPVQIVPLWLETIMNVFFFFLYPLRGLWFLLLSLPCCRAICCECESCTQNYAGETDQKCSRPLLSKGISPTCVHYNLTTINSKKSKQDEFLPYPAYKGDDDPLEEDDTEFVLQEMKRYRKE